ncbi:hypothetical protein ABTY20_09550 [Streptomyces sp. NPDC126497]|uniref:hypothetical protein n=1 Tax=Streptomyces sp. NPDC126497 TaxID=3155313 RepID=UPI00332093F6
MLDAQSAETSSSAPAAAQGIDAGKEIAGRERHIGVDTLGLLPAARVVAASVCDDVGGTPLMCRTAATHLHVTKARAGTDHRTQAIEHGARPGIDVEVVQREPGIKGLKVSPTAPKS